VLPFYGVFVADARLVLAFFGVELLLLGAVFFAIALLLALLVPVALVALLRVVLVLVFFAAVEVRPLVDGFCVECVTSPVGVAFLPVPRRVETPFS